MVMREKCRAKLKGQARVIALVTAQVAAGGVVESPDQAKDADNGVLLAGARAAQNLTSALTAETVIHLSQRHSTSRIPNEINSLRQLEALLWFPQQ